MSIDRGLIDQQLKELGEGSSWWERREMRDLPAILHADEQLLAIGRGALSRSGRVRPKWLIVVTDRRLLCVRSSGRSGWRQVEVPAGQIQRTGLRIGPMRARVIVVTSDRTYRLRVSRPDGNKLSTALSRIGSPALGRRAGSGPTVVIRRVIDHMLELPAAALQPAVPKALPVPVDLSAVDERVDALEQEVEQLREHVRFLEQLLQQKHIGSVEQIGSG